MCVVMASQPQTPRRLVATLDDPPRRRGDRGGLVLLAQDRQGRRVQRGFAGAFPRPRSSGREGATGLGQGPPLPRLAADFEVADLDPEPPDLASAWRPRVPSTSPDSA